MVAKYILAVLSVFFRALIRMARQTRSAAESHS
jgi:hypothetical protein